MFTVNKNPTVDDLHKFGWAMLVGFTVVGAVLWLAHWLKAQDAGLGWSGGGAQVTAVCLWVLAWALFTLSHLSPSVAKPVYVGWMTAVVPIGIVMSTLMLTVLFVLLLPVFSLVVRVGDPLRKKLTADRSYWEDYKPHEPTLERMRRPF
ncbi:MAG: hypothetical protein WBE26_17130 [Phycisphaerae bacterium]